MHLQIIICINVIIVLLIIIIIVFIIITIIIIVISNYGRPDVAIIRQRIQLKPQQFGREAWLLSGIILIVIINIIIIIITRQKPAFGWISALNFGGVLISRIAPLAFSFSTYLGTSQWINTIV